MGGAVANGPNPNVVWFRKPNVLWLRSFLLAIFNRWPEGAPHIHTHLTTGVPSLDQEVLHKRTVTKKTPRVFGVGRSQGRVWLVWLPGHTGRLCFFGLSSELQPLSSEIWT